MAIWFRSGGNWVQFPTPTPIVNPLWARDADVGGSSWYATLAVYVRDQGQWKKEPTYIFKPVAPTNFHVTSTSTDHSGVSLAWNYTGIAEPVQFRLRAYDYGTSTSNTPKMTEYLLPSGYRTFRVSGNNRYFSFTLASEAVDGSLLYFGTGASGAGQAPRWHVGYDAYTVNDVPVYGWGDYYEWRPPVKFTSGIYQGSSGSYAADNNMSTEWISDAHSETNTSKDWVGMWFGWPSGNHLYQGCRVIQDATAPPCYMAHGVYYNHVWQGTDDLSVYMDATVHGYLKHKYFGLYSVARDDYIYNETVNYDTDGGSYPADNLTAVTFGENLTTRSGILGYVGMIREVRLLISDWVVVRYDPRTVPAVASGAW